MVPYLNQYVEERAGDAEKDLLAGHVRTRRRLLYELSNCKPDAAGLRWFQGRWGATLRAEAAADVWTLREQLRAVWAKPAIHIAEQVLNAWLSAHPGGDKPRLAFTCSIGAGRLVPDRADLRAMLIQGVLENWRHFHLCANTDCASPYFIAKRKDQLVCDAEICKAEKQRAHALKWWHDHRAENVTATGAGSPAKKSKPRAPTAKRGKLKSSKP